ncbi:hypothetical protein CSAL01_08093 [Colletotrichum salicis]|uniref:Uncharacterized protein n=1 Tax=Colletotrichum salicis TaxID=1209931 RepID=A0A135T1I3_9PEZI|nr:hypothetical protein CSAL01_08093 [Colletotrichum salicis]
MVAAAASSPLPFLLFFHRLQNRNPAIPTTTRVPAVAPIAIPATAPPDSSSPPGFGVLVTLDALVGDETNNDVEDEGDSDDEGDELGQHQCRLASISDLSAVPPHLLVFRLVCLSEVQDFLLLYVNFALLLCKAPANEFDVQLECCER